VDDDTRLARQAANDFLRICDVTPTPDAVDQLVEVFLPCLKIMCERPWSPDGSTWRRSGILGAMTDAKKKWERFWERTWKHGKRHDDSGYDLINYVGFIMRSEPGSGWGEWGPPAVPQSENPFTDLGEISGFDGIAVMPTVGKLFREMTEKRTPLDFPSIQKYIEDRFRRANPDIEDDPPWPSDDDPSTEDPTGLGASYPPGEDGTTFHEIPHKVLRGYGVHDVPVFEISGDKPPQFKGYADVTALPQDFQDTLHRLAGDLKNFRGSVTIKDGTGGQAGTTVPINSEETSFSIYGGAGTGAVMAAEAGEAPNLGGYQPGPASRIPRRERLARPGDRAAEEDDEALPSGTYVDGDGRPYPPMPETVEARRLREARIRGERP
jgi:hypothetical protein